MSWQTNVSDNEMIIQLQTLAVSLEQKLDDKKVNPDQNLLFHSVEFLSWEVKNTVNKWVINQFTRKFYRQK